VCGDVAAYISGSLLVYAVMWLRIVVGPVGVCTLHCSDCTETCRSCFNVNSNINFKIVY